MQGNPLPFVTQLDYEREESVFFCLFFFFFFLQISTEGLHLIETSSKRVHSPSVYRLQMKPVHLGNNLWRKNKRSVLAHCALLFG